MLPIYLSGKLICILTSHKRYTLFLMVFFPINYMIKLRQVIVEPACGERDIVVTTSVLCMCVVRASVVRASVVRASVRPSEIVRAITRTFMHGFQNNLRSCSP